MPLTINTNMASLTAQFDVSKTQNALNSAIAQLSSGLKLNSAADDPAGMAISQRFTAQINGMGVAVQNANDGKSLLQTSEGGMQEVTTLLQRMRDLAVQASNDTNSTSDRKSLQNQLEAYYHEIDRISASTKFNNIGLLDGTGGTLQLQVGANAGETISVALGSTKTLALGLTGSAQTGMLNSGRVGGVNGSQAAAADSLYINGYDITGGASDAISEAATINAQTTQTGVIATTYNSLTGSAGASGVTNGLIVNGTILSATTDMASLVNTINQSVAGVTAALDSSGDLVMSNTTGQNISIGGAVTNSGLSAGTYGGYVSLSNALSSNTTPITVSAGTMAGAASGLMLWGLNASTGSSSITSGTVTTNNLAAGDLVINGVAIGATTSDSAGAKALAITAQSTLTGVTATATTSLATTVNFSNVLSASGITINGTSLGLTAATATTLTSMDVLISTINTATNGSVIASANANGTLELTSTAGLDINIGSDGSGVGDALLQTDATTASSLTQGTISLTSTGGGAIDISSNSATPNAALANAGLTGEGGSGEALASGLSLSSTANANNAITMIDKAIDIVSTDRANLGAIQNRLSLTIDNLKNASNNMSAANSGLTDADFAAETAMMTKEQVMMQAGTAMLAQTKALPQQILTLLQ